MTIVNWHVRIDTDYLIPLTTSGVSRLMPLEDSQTADAIWLEIHHEMPSLVDESSHKHDEEDYLDTTLCLRGFLSITPHGYATVDLSECLTRQSRGFRTDTTIRLYGLLGQSPEDFYEPTSRFVSHYSSPLSSKKIPDTGNMVESRICPRAPAIINTTICSTSPVALEYQSMSVSASMVRTSTHRFPRIAQLLTSLCIHRVFPTNLSRRCFWNPGHSGQANRVR